MATATIERFILSGAHFHPDDGSVDVITEDFNDSAAADARAVDILKDTFTAADIDFDDKSNFPDGTYHHDEAGEIVSLKVVKIDVPMPDQVYALLEPPESEDYQDNEPTVTLYADHKKAQEALAEAAIKRIDSSSDIDSISIDTGDDCDEEVEADEARELLAKGTDCCEIDEFDGTYTLQVKTLAIN